MKIFLAITGVIFILLGFTGCGEKNDTAEAAPEISRPANPNGLSDFEMENGVGPVKAKLTLAELDMMKVKKGEKLFTEKCSACHKLDERYVGPAQGDLLNRRTPEYAMNMMLNPEEMLRKHPEAKKMLAEYMTPMPFQNISNDDALLILEYFRYTATQTKK